MAPTATVFPKQLKENIDQLKKEIIRVESKVDALNSKNKSNAEKDSEKEKKLLSLAKSGRPTPASKATSSSRSQCGYEKGKSENVCKCCGHRNPQSSLPCLGRVTTRVCGRDHVHHTIRIPADELFTKKPATNEKKDHQKRPENRDKTWGEIFQDTESKGRKTPRKEQLRDQNVKPVSKTPVGEMPGREKRAEDRRKDLPPEARRDKEEKLQKTGEKKDERRRADREPADNNAIAEMIAVLQAALRGARAEREAAKKEAARCFLAAEKLNTVMEAKVICDKHVARCTEMTEKEIQERLREVQQNSMTGLATAIDEIRAAAASPSPTAGTKSSGSRRLRHSSPTWSKRHEADATEDWNDFSSIQSFSYLTL